MNKYFSAFLLLCILSAAVSDDSQCPRYSPAEIWHSDYAPWLEQILLELKVYFNLIFGRVEQNLFLFMPHIEQDSGLAGNMTLAFHTMHDMIIDLLDDVHKQVATSWLRLNEVSDAFIDKGMSPAAEMVVNRRLEGLAEEAKKQHQRMDDGLSDVSLFFRSLTAEALEGVTRMLEEELEEPPEGDGAIVKLIQQKIAKVAPGDLLGSALSKILGRGLGTSKPYSSEPILLKDVIERVDELLKDYEQYRNDLTVESWKKFWQEQFDKSLPITNKRAAEGNEDFDEIFRNEFYVSEILMNIMTYYDAKSSQ